MGAGRGRRTVGPHIPSAGPSASSSSPVQFLNLPVGELASVIFGCSHATYDECVNQLIFGLPRAHYCYIKNIRPGLPLFLFNYTDRKLHGIFEAASRGDLDINPAAWTGGKAGRTQFSAQVRVRVKCRCSPLSEKVFKEAIAANYYKGAQHFYFELNRVQTDVLESLFTRNTTYTSSQAGPSAWPQGGDDEGWIKQKKTAMDAWYNAEPFPAQTLPAQSEGRADTPEHSDDGADKVEDETIAGNGGPDSEDAVNRSLEPAAEKCLDLRETVMLSNGEVEEDHRKAEWELDVFEKPRQLKQEGKMQSNPEIRAEFPRVWNESLEEASGSSFVESTEIQDSARVEQERLARERCLQEQTMLREERELLRDTFQANAINENSEICASANAQTRQDEIKSTHVMDEALNQAELLTELDQVRKKNAILEDTQVQMASEIEGLKSDVARLSQQLQTNYIFIRELVRGMQ